MTSNSMSLSSGSASYDRKLKYRALLDDLSTLDENEDNMQRMEKTASVVREAGILLTQGDVKEHAEHPGESYLDSRVLRATSDLAVSCSEAVSGNVNIYDKRELAQHIKENPDFWNFTFPREVPVLAYLFGTFAPTPPEQRPRVPRRRVERQQAAELKAPDTVDRLEKTEEGSEMVSRVNRFISKAYRNGGEKPLSYFHVVLDPNSFSRTVENIYYISFLVRDGLLAIDLDKKSGLPFMTPLKPNRNSQHDISEENQFIVAFNMQRWQEMVEAFRINQPMMVLKRL